MNNKKRNELILNLACEFLDKINFEIEKAFVEDLSDEDENKQVLISLTVPNPAGLIGLRGKNLAALQLILSLMVKNKINDEVRVLLDVNNYRQDQKIRLEKMTKSLAEKVLQTGKEISLGNMSSYERRICHMVAAEIDGIKSESEGEGEERHIVIKPKN